MSIPILSIALFASASAPPQLVAARPVPRFEKVVLDDAFRSEGAATADFDRDGDLDVLAGELWYEAPSWTPHEVAPPGQYDPVTGYSASFLNAAFDVDGDGWSDAIVVSFPGAPCHWFRNPQGAAVHWQRHLIARTANNESPRFADVDDDGRTDVILGLEATQQLVWLEPRPDPTLAWRVHPISQPGAPGAAQFYHGLGFADLDLDGREDVLTPEGWYAGPPDPETSSTWTFHPVDWMGTSAFGDQMAAQVEAFDIDGDGDQDVVTSSPHSYGLWWWEQVNGPTAPFVEHLIADDFSQPHALVAADIDGDGDRDLVTGKRWYAHGPGGDPGSLDPAVLYWFELRRGPGGVTFPRRILDPEAESGVGTQFEVVDIDLEGRLDVVVANKKGVFVFRRL